MMKKTKKLATLPFTSREGGWRRKSGGCNPRLEPVFPGGGACDAKPLAQIRGVLKGRKKRNEEATED